MDWFTSIKRKRGIILDVTWKGPWSLDKICIGIIEEKFKLCILKKSARKYTIHICPLRMPFGLIIVYFCVESRALLRYEWLQSMHTVACASLNMQTSTGRSLSTLIVRYHSKGMSDIRLRDHTVVFFLPCHSTQSFKSHSYIHTHTRCIRYIVSSYWYQHTRQRWQQNKPNNTIIIYKFGYGSAVCTSKSLLFVDLLKNSNDFYWTISLDGLTTTVCLYMSNIFMDGARYVSAWPVKVTIFWIIRKIICYLYSNLMINLNGCIRSAFEHDAKRGETLFKSIICASCVFISYFNIDILMSLSSMKWLWFVSAHLVCQRRASQSITSLFLFHFYWRWLLGAYFCMIANTKRDRECASMWMNQYWIRWAYVVVVNLLWRGYKHWSSWIRAGAVVAVICVCVSPLF